MLFVNYVSYLEIFKIFITVQNYLLIKERWHEIEFIINQELYISMVFFSTIQNVKTKYR